MVRWMELRRRPARRRAERDARRRAPRPGRQVLRETVLEKVPTVVLTSATLATRGDFGFLRGRLGLCGERRR